MGLGANEPANHQSWADAWASRFDSFPERTDNLLIETLDAVLLFLANSGLRFDDDPKFENTLLNFLDIDIVRDSVTTHLVLALMGASSMLTTGPEEDIGAAGADATGAGVGGAGGDGSEVRSTSATTAWSLN